MPKTKSQELLLAIPAKDRMAGIVKDIVTESRRGYAQISDMHQEALMNSLALSPMDKFVTPDAPYGQSSGFASGTNQQIGSIVSPFTAEQVNAITTRIVAPLIGQRDVIYVEPQGAEDNLKCAVSERLFDRTIRSPWTCWADLCWRTGRDLVVRSRAYWEVRPLKIVRKRRQYQYEQATDSQDLLDSGIDPQELASFGIIRTSYMAPKVLWNGPVISPMLYGTVHKDRNDTLISDSSLFHVIEREMPWGQFVIEGKAMFPRGGETIITPFNEKTAELAVGSTYETGRGASASGDFDPIASSPKVYEPVHFQEFRGINPLGDATEEIVAWVCGGETLGEKGWDGSGSCLSIVEWCWDPINGMATSVGPGMLLRSPQEMLSTLLNCATTGAIWDSVLSGGINTDRVMHPNQVKNLHPTQFFNMTGTTADGPPIFPIELGRNAAATMQFIRDQEAGLRLATAGISSVVGEAPAGVNTLGEYAGVTQGALDRIGTQSEINMDVAMRRTFRLQHAIWRDGLTTDVELQAVLGQSEDVIGATLADLDDDDRDVTPLGTRYHAVRKQTVDAITALKDQAASNPILMARLKPEIDDDLGDAIGGPRARRWLRSTSECAALGVDLNALYMQQIQNAMAPPTKGEASPPKDQPTTGAGQVESQQALQ